jgi:hypothetical protein
MVSDVVSRSAAEWENILVSFLAQKNLTKKPLTMLRDNIVAIERLYRLYGVAQRQSLIRVRPTHRDEDANADADGGGPRIAEKLDRFSADIIVSRLTRRSDILTPFFILLDHLDQVDEDGITAITRMLGRFISDAKGLSRLWRLPFFYVIEVFVISPSRGYHWIHAEVPVCALRFCDGVCWRDDPPPRVGSTATPSNACGRVNRDLLLLLLSDSAREGLGLLVATLQSRIIPATFSLGCLGGRHRTTTRNLSYLIGVTPIRSVTNQSCTPRGDLNSPISSSFSSCSTATRSELNSVLSNSVSEETLPVQSETSDPEGATASLED